MKFDGFLTLYQEGQDDAAEDDESQAPARDERRAKRSTSASRSPDPAFHRAAAALFGSLAGQAHGRARHRPALDLRLDPAGAAGPRLCAASTRSASTPRTRAAWSPRSSRTSSPATSNTTSPPSLEEQLDRVSDGEVDWRAAAARLLARFHRRGRRHQGRARRAKCSTRSTRSWRRTSSRRSDDGTDPRQCPTCGTGRLSLKLGRFGALHRLLELSRMPLHPPARRSNGAARRRHKVLGKDPDTGLEVAHARPAASAPMCSSAKRKDDEEKPKRAGIPKGTIARRHRRSTARSSCCRCRAKSASTRTTASRSWPASAASAPTCSTARPTRTSTPSEDVLTIGLNRAVTLIAEKRANARQGPPLRRRPGPRARRPSRNGRRRSW